MPLHSAGCMHIETDLKRKQQCGNRQRMYRPHYDRTCLQIPGDTGKKCDVKISIDYPTAYKSESDLARLNALLASQIFGAEYSQYTSLKEAADTIAQHTLNEMKDGLTTLCNEIELSSEITFTSLTQIAPVYNNNDFLSYNINSY